MATYTNLSYGSKGDDVKKLQQSLINAGYSVGSKGADGNFGNDTMAAVKKYQQDNGLTADGIAGNNTLSKLYSTGGSSSGTANKAKPDYSGFKYDASSDANYMKAIAALQEVQKKTPTYANSYEGQLKDIYDQIVNRDKFTYDLNADMLYQQYKDQYVNLGQMAMKDTMGQAAGLTGGYGSSYGQAVGQQQYDAYLQRLNDVVPDLYGMALDKYNREGDDLARLYSLTGDMADDEYAKYQDAYNQWLTERNYLQGQADDAYNRGYESWYNAYKMGVDADERAYSRQQDTYNRIANLITTTGYTPSSAELSAAGMSQSELNALKSLYKPKVSYVAASPKPKEKEPETSDPSFSTYSEAVAYMKAKGVSNGAASGILTSAEWNRKKSSGSKSSDVNDFSTYKDYLNDVVEYKIKNK